MSKEIKLAAVVDLVFHPHPKTTVDNDHFLFKQWISNPTEHKEILTLTYSHTHTTHSVMGFDEVSESC